MPSDLLIRVGGVECANWDDISIDSDIGIPADSFSFSWLNNSSAVLPAVVVEAATCEVWHSQDSNTQQVLAGVIDSISQSYSRGSKNISIAGRDLAGQLLDCSAPIDHAQNLSLGEIVNRFVLSGDLASLPFKFNTPSQNWLKAKTGVEPSESLWDVIAKAAQSSGQYVWMAADGTLKIGNPFAVAQPSLTPQLIFNKQGDKNNVLMPDYRADISNAYSVIDSYGQTAKGKNFSAKATDSRLPFTRRKLTSDARADSQIEAQAFAKKTLQDGWLDAYQLSLAVNGWSWQGQVWQTGWAVSFSSDVMPRSAGDWVIYGRTLKLSRTNGKTTELRLRRKASWMQPPKHTELVKK